MKKNSSMPRLRFPEFEKDGEWVKKALSEVADYENGKAHEQDIVAEGKYIAVNSKFISTDGEIVKYCNTAFCLAKLGDILMVLSDVPNGRAIAKCFYVNEDEKYTVNQRICKITPFDCNNRFLYYIMNRNPYFLSFDDGVKQTNLRNDDVQNFPFLLTINPQEQQKIASCLSSLDELIAAHSDKLEALKDHKKGLIQNLFPQEGQKVPNYRFPEFEGDGEWVEDTLGNRGDFTGGGTPSKGNPAFWKGDFPWISSSDLSEDTIHHIEISRFITKDAIKNSATKVVPKNSLLIVSRVGVGKVAITTKEISTSQDFTNFTPQKDDVEFLGYYLKCNTNILLRFSQGMAIKGFTKDDIVTLSLSFPTNLQEQQKIASCLTTVDEVITAQAEKINQLQQHKKGLMQGLFPKIV